MLTKTLWPLGESISEPATLSHPLTTQSTFSLGLNTRSSISSYPGTLMAPLDFPSTWENNTPEQEQQSSWAVASFLVGLIVIFWLDCSHARCSLLQRFLLSREGLHYAHAYAHTLDTISKLTRPLAGVYSFIAAQPHQLLAVLSKWLSNRRA